jgi:hypothetical protein
VSLLAVRGGGHDLFVRSALGGPRAVDGVAAAVGFLLADLPRPSSSRKRG